MDAGEYYRRIEILRATPTRDAEGGVSEAWEVVRKAWARDPKIAQPARIEINDEDKGRARMDFIVLREAARDVTTADRIRDHGIILVILFVVTISETETQISCEMIA